VSEELARFALRKIIEKEMARSNPIKSALERAVGLTLRNNDVSIGEACDGENFRPPDALPTQCIL
jgi:hypothetical protein